MASVAVALEVAVASVAAVVKDSNNNQKRKVKTITNSLGLKETPAKKK